jgi:hypothetical protein
VRVTQAQLVDLARREVERRAEDDGLLAAYLIGSLVHDRALLGGSADIDLVLIHEHQPEVEREIVALSEDIHLDIAHHDRGRYAQPRELRSHPWNGPAIYDPIPLHDPQHFFEWAQASIRGQFLRADYRLARGRAFVGRARRLQASLDSAGDWVGPLARAAYLGANGIASLVGPPASGRRALPTLRDACGQAGCPQAYDGILRLLGADSPGLHEAPLWVGDWARAFDAAAPLTAQPALLPERRSYYLKGFQALLESGDPQSLLVCLFDTWGHLLAVLRAFDLEAEHRSGFEAAARALGLSPAAAGERFADLDAYLDHLETVLDDWSVRHGA